MSEELKEKLFPRNPIDKTTIINGTIFVSKDDKAVSGYATVFHRILKRFNDFGVLDNIDYDFKSKLFETFLKESISKKNWGQYFFNMFKGAKLKFRITDRRCKIVDIDKFYTSSHWSVDRWWTRDERIELGIEEEKCAVDINTYISMINDTSQLLNESIEPLQDLIRKQLASTKRKQVALSDPSLFILSLGKRVLKKDYITSKGNIPVFSANVFEPFVYTDQSNITKFDKDFVLWGIDGVFTFNVMKKGTPFASTDHCGTIKIINEDIDPYYLAYMMEETRHKYGFDRGLRASLTNMKLFKIDIPVKDDGTFDIDVQRSIAESLLCLRQTRTMIYEKMNRLIEQKIEI